jgi:hypothetical protein
VGTGYAGLISSVSGTTLTLVSNAVTIPNSATLQISAFPQASASSGTEPATSPASSASSAAISFAASTASWGTVTSFGFYDAVSSGNLIDWDYLGNYKWLPFTCTSASPGVLSTDLTADAPANGSSIVVTQKYGGTLPTTGGSWSGILTTANLSSNTFTAGVNTTSIGGGLFRQVTQQAIASSTTVTFSSSQLTVTSA